MSEAPEGWLAAVLSRAKDPGEERPAGAKPGYVYVYVSVYVYVYVCVCICICVCPYVT